MEAEGVRWRTESMDLIVLDLLRKREGTIKEDELFEMLKAMMKGFCASELNKVLMDLELRGKINVAMQKKVRVITLLKPRGGQS